MFLYVSKYLFEFFFEIFIEYLVDNGVEDIVGVGEYFIDDFDYWWVILVLFVFEIWLKLENFVG